MAATNFRAFLPGIACCAGAFRYLFCSYMVLCDAIDCRVTQQVCHHDKRSFNAKRLVNR